VLKFQAVAEKTTKDARGLLYFAAPGTYTYIHAYIRIYSKWWQNASQFTI